MSIFHIYPENQYNNTGRQKFHGVITADRTSISGYPAFDSAQIQLTNSLVRSFQ